MVFNIQTHERKIFDQISTAAEDLSFPTYVVGGYVRDRLLGRPSKDMDIVCVGSGIKLAKHVGFTEIARLEDARDVGDDMVVLRLRREDCKYLGD